MRCLLIYLYVLSVLTGVFVSVSYEADGASNNVFVYTTCRLCANMKCMCILDKYRYTVGNLRCILCFVTNVFF